VLHTRSFVAGAIRPVTPIKDSPSIICEREDASLWFRDQCLFSLREKRYSRVAILLPSWLKKDVVMALIDFDDRRDARANFGPDDLALYNLMPDGGCLSTLVMFQYQLSISLDSWESDWKGTLLQIETVLSVKVC
jgi:hypothetical protein